MQFEQPTTLQSGTRTIRFKNRLVRSSLGGRMAYYDGTVNNAWKNFEYHFAKFGLGGIISATMSVNEKRHSPLEYPQIDKDEYIGPLQDGVGAVQSLDCRYIMQIGDCGYHTQTSLFSDPAEGQSSSAGFDLLYGFRNFRTAMTKDDIKWEIDLFAKAADRVKRIGCDGLELTAAKGYLIHQFLNPAINRRRDEYGEDRFLFLEQIVTAIRSKIGRDFLFGVRLSAQDYSHRPLNLRWPPGGSGNGLQDTIEYGRRLKKLGIDFLHVTNGFGFVCPNDNPGDFPLEEYTIFCDSTRHLSTKAALRATAMHTPLKYAARLGWKRMPPGSKLPDTIVLKKEVGLPVIVNGGFQERSLIEKALQEGCDLVSVARPVIANPDLYHILQRQEKPANPCSFCNRCDLRTSLFPVGCYDVERFSGDYQKMERQIIELSGNPTWPHPKTCIPDVCVSPLPIPPPDPVRKKAVATVRRVKAGAIWIAIAIAVAWLAKRR
jgi:2,4-dienoyl-CoA reductase-like NADH-dependent reductase (Old Yellow Enzyme family)